MNRLLKIAGIAIGALALLFVAAALVAYLLVDLDKLVNEQVARFKPLIEEKVGRKVEVGKVSTRFLPTLGGRVEAIALAPDPSRPEDDRPLLRIGSVGFEVQLWDALLSGGKKVVVARIWLDGLEVNLVRYKGGALSFQDILDRRPAAPGEPARPSDPAKATEPLSPEVQAFLRGVSIGEIRLADARIRLVDLDTPSGKPAESFVNRLNVRLGEVRLSDPIAIRVDAAVFGEATNFVLETSVGPLPADLKVEGLPSIGFVRLKVDEVDLSRVTPYLGPGAAADIDSALLSTHWELTEVSRSEPFEVEGFLAVTRLQLDGGQPFDLRVDARARLDLAAIGAEIARLDVKVGAVELAMSGSLSDLAATPRFKDFTLRSSTLDPATLLSYYPKAKTDLPPGMRLGGPIRIDLKASGDATRQTVKGEVDLASLDLLWPGTFLKPRGTPLALRVDGDFTASDANLRGLNLVVDELELAVAGTVKDFADPTMDLSLKARPFSFDRLARLLPQANRALAAAQAKASGAGRLEGHVRGTLERLDAGLELALLGIKLDVPGTRLDGDVTLKVAVTGNPAKDLAASFSLDADRALILVDGALHKLATTPLHLAVAVKRAGDLVRVERLDLRLAELDLGASGSLDLARGTTDVKLAMARLDLERFARTVVAIPADQARGGFVDARLALAGDPNRLESMELALSPFNARLGRSDLRGEVRVADLVKPRVVVRLSCDLLDVDQWVPPSDGEAPSQEKAEQPAGPRPAPPEDRPEFKDYRLAARIDAKKIVVSGTELTDFVGDLRLEDGLLRLEEATFKAFGGVFTAKGSEAEIWKGRTPFKANLGIKGLDLNAVLSAKSRHQDLLFGRGDLDLRLAGQGFETEDLERHLSGELLLALAEGRFARGSLVESVAGDLRPLERVPGVSLQAVRGENHLEALSAHFAVKDGRMTLTRPMTASVDGNKVALDGAVGIAGALFLQGDFLVSPALVNRLTSGKCKSDQELKVPVAIGGTLDKPEFRPDGRSAATALAERCLKGAAGQALRGALVDKLGLEIPVDRAAAEAKAREAAAKARAEATRVAAETEARARAEADRLKAVAETRVREETARLEQAKLDAEKKAREEAEKKKREAEEAAKKKAQDAAGKAVKGLFP